MFKKIARDHWGPLFGTLALIAAGVLLFSFSRATIVNITPEMHSEEYVTVIEKIVPEGATFGLIAEEANVPPAYLASILEAAEDIYDLSTIVSGRALSFVYAPDGKFRGLRYTIDAEKQLVVEKIDGPAISTGGVLPALENATAPPTWEARIENIAYETVHETAEGIITSSLYETMVESGIDQRLAIELSEVFAWQFDFALDVQEGDSFKVYYEKRYKDGEYVMPGRILAAEFTNSGTTYKAFYFRGSETDPGYYNESGEALQKQFLKAPLQYRYISSGYTLSRRTPILGGTMPHRAIDYAAPYGTPSVTVGDGVVTQAGWRQYYGLSVTVRHNDTYHTVYGHFQSLARGINAGARVTQGQVIGYVGSTGLSTGPHLHFELHKHGSPINPLTYEAPAGSPVAEADREQFAITLKRLRDLSGI